MNELKNEQGFSLIELLIGSAILFVSLSALSDVLIMNAKGQINATSESNISSIFDQVQQIAGAEWSCTASFAGSSYLGAIAVKDPVNNLNVVANEGMGSTGFWSMNQIRMQGVTAVQGQPGVLRGTLYLQASKNNGVNLGTPTLTRSINNIYFEVNPDNTIARCYTTSDTVAAAQSACQLLGGTWNANPPHGASNCQLSQGS